MCGILGSVNFELSDSELNLLKHRGPEYQRLDRFNCNDVPVCLGHTRLAIVDVSESGNQPMSNESVGSKLVFNGEIYNHMDLRPLHTQFEYRSHSDSETLLKAFDQSNVEVLNKLNGIFAFCHYNPEEQQLVLARDPFGVKPIYYFWDGNRFIFSSELKVISSAVKDLELQEDNLEIFLKLRYNPSPETLFKNVFKLRPGHYVKFDLKSNRLSDQIFYSYRPKKSDYSVEEALEAYEQKLVKAVERQLLSDVPISIMLSGGVDSALVAQIAKNITGESYNSYTAGFDDVTEIDEVKSAARSAEIIGLNHVPVIIPKSNFVEDLAKFIEIIEEPLGSQSITPMFHLAKDIHQDGYKVVLSGQGVDEPWGGYPKYNLQNLMGKMPNLPYSSVPFVFEVLKGDKSRRALNTMSKKSRSERFIETCSVLDDRFLGKLVNEYHPERTKTNLTAHFEYALDTYGLNKMTEADALMAFDARMNLSDDLLLYTDKIAMYHSLEVRVPFLDIELMEFAESVKSALKVSLKKNKLLHKQFAEKYLPSEIVHRKKQHFATPRKKWLKEETGKQIESLLMNDNGYFGNYFNKKELAQLFAHHRNGKQNYEKQLYQLISMYFWMKSFVDK
jgi:asparagine synthase (glutamine-hydrolysing)